MGVAVLEGKLYSVGGRDGSSCLSSVEVYDPHTDKWTMASPMLKRRGGKTVVYITAIFVLYSIVSKSNSLQFIAN